MLAIPVKKLAGGVCTAIGHYQSWVPDVQFVTILSALINRPNLLIWSIPPRHPCDIFLFYWGWKWTQFHQSKTRWIWIPRMTMGFWTPRPFLLGSEAAGITKPSQWHGHSACNNRWFTATRTASCCADGLVHLHHDYYLPVKCVSVEGMQWQHGRVGVKCGQDPVIFQD